MKNIVIVASTGRFQNVTQAAHAEKSVKWFVPDPDADAVTESFAAAELRNGLQCLFHHSKGSAPEIRFAAPEQPLESDIDLHIILGTMQSSQLVRLLLRKNEVAAIHGEGYLIRAGTQNNVRFILIAGLERKGVLNGVFRYLEELGMRWISPDQPQAVWPNNVKAWNASLHIVESPHFEFRGMYYADSKQAGTDDLLIWMTRNRLNMGSAGLSGAAFAKKLGLKLVGGGHLFQKIMDPDREFKPGVKLYDAHPEWFPLMHDNMRCRGKGYLCMSNPKGRKYLVENVKQMILKDADWLDIFRFWPADSWGQGCCCRECRKIGNNADLYLLLVHELRQAMDAAHAQGKLRHRIGMFFICYEGSSIYPPPTRPLPKGFDLEMNWMEVWPINRCYAHRQADPTCREFNLHYWRDLCGWRKTFPGKIVMGEYYNVSQYFDMATVFAEVMRADFKDYARIGIAGAQYMHVAPKHWGPRALTNWQFGRLLWNPGSVTRNMQADFFKQRFGALGPMAERLYRCLDQAMANLSAIKSWMAGSVSYRLRHVYGEMTADRSTEDLFVYDHLRFHRPHGSNGRIGFGLDNFDDIMAALQEVHAGLSKLRGRSALDPVVKANLDEDLWQIAYTLDFIGIHYEFARYWEAESYGRGQSALHKRRVIALARKLHRTKVRGIAAETGNALENTDLIKPMQRAFNFKLQPE